jgi:peptidyl-prolyl cis-trans isomerase B (cyclophilin B)
LFNKRNNKRYMLSALLLLAILLVLAGCGVDRKSPNTGGAAGGGSTPSTETATPSPSPSPSPEPTPEGPELLDSDQHPEVTLEISNGKNVVIELYPEVAPNSVSNFVSLVKQGFYDGLIFHRVIPGFMVQGGDPEGTGMGGPGYSIAGEFNSNGFENELKHKRGVLSMARSGDPNSAGSQFFIMVEDAPHLDGDYAAFGQVIEGIETVDEIVNQKTGANDRPVEPLSITKATVNLKELTINEPEKVEGSETTTPQ